MEDITGGTSKGTNKAVVGVRAQALAATDAATPGGVVVTPPLQITWLLKVVGTMVALVPFPLLLVTLSALSSPIWSKHTTIGMCLICVVLISMLITIQ
jgi:hypothetical protein